MQGNSCCPECSCLVPLLDARIRISINRFDVPEPRGLKSHEAARTVFPLTIHAVL